MPRTAYGCSRLLRWLPAVLTIVLLWTCLHYRTLWTHRTLRTLGDSQTPGQTAGRTIRDTDTDTNTVLNQHNDIHVADSESNDVRKDIEIRVPPSSGKPSTVYVITPTHARSTQHPDLTRVAHALMLDSNTHWIVIEDRNETSPWLVDLLTSSGLPFTLLHCQGVESPNDTFSQKPSRIKRNSKKPRKFSFGPGKGVVQRNCGLQWIENQGIEDGAFYFADDDNTYDYRLFQEIRTTVGVSVFPVGHLRSTGVSSPVVKDGHVISFLDPWQGGRKLQVDMAGFAVNVRLWRQKRCPKMGGGKGMLEELFLLNMDIKMEDLEPKAQNCSKVLVWHTQTKDVTATNSRLRTKMRRYASTNLDALSKQAYFVAASSIRQTNLGKKPVHPPEPPQAVLLSVQDVKSSSTTKAR